MKKSLFIFLSLTLYVFSSAQNLAGTYFWKKKGKDKRTLSLYKDSTYKFKVVAKEDSFVVRGNWMERKDVIVLDARTHWSKTSGLLNLTAKEYFLYINRRNIKLHNTRIKLYQSNFHFPWSRKYYTIRRTFKEADF